MTFILEILPKLENSNEFVYVVRAQNGFPLAVCDSLEASRYFIHEKFEEMRKGMNSDK